MSTDRIFCNIVHVQNCFWNLFNTEKKALPVAMIAGAGGGLSLVVFVVVVGIIVIKR